MKKEEKWENLGDLFGKVQTKKPPAYQWQELALKIMKELNIPNFKRSSIFKVCRDNHKESVERALSDTKELCTSGEKWRYFLKVISSPPAKATDSTDSTSSPQASSLQSDSPTQGSGQAGQAPQAEDEAEKK